VRLAYTWLLIAATALSGCDTTPAVIMTHDGASSRPSPVSLSPDVRGRLQKRFDVDALEELLGTMSVAERAEVLSQLGGSGNREAETTDVVVPMRSTDPVRQALLDRVWAPFWSHLPPEALDRDDLPYPGRELARARRTRETKEKPGERP
jgi:hypothetical protein